MPNPSLKCVDREALAHWERREASPTKESGTIGHQVFITPPLRRHPAATDSNWL